MEIGVHRHALRLEEAELIVLADRQSQRIERYLAGGLLMDTADVDCELLVDEDPDVVVAEEVEALAAEVGELEMNHRGEEVVMPVLLGLEDMVVEAASIRGEVARAGEGGEPTRLVIDDR